MNHFSADRADTLADDLQILLGDLCREWGFCNALADDLIVADDSLTSDAFATAVLAAEGWKVPEADEKWRPRLKAVFEARYGAEVSDGGYTRSVS